MDLDDAYANAPYIPDAESYPPRWAADAAQFREKMGARAELDVPYGARARQTYDFFSAEGAAKGTLVFVHGGYWLKFDKTSWSHFAEGGLAAGWDVALVQYDLCPTVSIGDITNQIARAIRAIATRTKGPLSLTGHSAGGHLVARMLAPGMLPADVAGRIARVAPISPVSDLRPLLQTTMNEQFGLTLASASAESPVLQPSAEVPVRIWVGADERPVFLEQAQALAEAWDVDDIVVPHKHHFDIIDALKDAQSDLIRFLTG